MLVGVLLVFSSASTALLLSAVLVFAGTIGLVTSAVAGTHAAPSSAPAGRRSGPLRAPGFAVVVLAIFGLGLGLGPVDVAIAARAQTAGHPAAAGYLLGALSVGSAVGGLLWGRLTHRRRHSTQLAGLLGVLAVGSALGAAGPSLPVLAVVLAAAGAALSPAYVVAYLAADELVPEGGRTEAGTWVNTANNIGVSLGAAGAGALIDRLTPGLPLAIGAGIVLLTAAALLAS